ncbi:hypothetical protein Tco_0105513 [Tanacetum coccineum]
MNLLLNLSLPLHLHIHKKHKFYKQHPPCPMIHLSQEVTHLEVLSSMKLKELTDLCTKLVARVTSLEKELKNTKKVHGKALTKLVKKVKRLKDELKSTNKRKKAKMVIPDEEGSQVSTAAGLVITAEDIQDTDEEQTKALEQQEQERANLEDELKKLQKTVSMIRVGNITEAYQGFEDMLKAFDREDLDTLWSLVKEKFRSVEPTEDMERALWVELKRLYEPDKEDTLWKLQRYMHDPLTWRLYGSCAVHHVFSTRGHCIYMLPEKDYPLTTEVMMLMLSRRLQVEEDIIKEYLVKVNKRRAFWSLNEDILKITILKTNTPYPSRRYSVSVPELTKDHEGNKPVRRIQKKAIRRIEDIVCEDSGRYQSWSLLQESPNTPYLIP